VTDFSFKSMNCVDEVSILLKYYFLFKINGKLNGGSPIHVQYVSCRLKIQVLYQYYHICIYLQSVVMQPTEQSLSCCIIMYMIYLQHKYLIT
jgi:hypothetical protein